MKTRMFKEFLQNYKFEEVEKSYEEFIGINDYFDKEKTYQEILEKLKHKNIGINTIELYDKLKIVYNKELEKHRFKKLFHR